jgi:cysteine synthase
LWIRRFNVVFQDVTETVDKTPLVELRRIDRDRRARILAKLEMRNPCGSVKDVSASR